MTLYARRKAVAKLIVFASTGSRPDGQPTVLQGGCQQFHVALPLLNIAARRSLPVGILCRKQGFTGFVKLVCYAAMSKATAAHTANPGRLTGR